MLLDGIYLKKSYRSQKTLDETITKRKVKEYDSTVNRREIIEQHEGTISAKSALGQGSTFTFSIPFKLVEKETKEMKGKELKERQKVMGKIILRRIRF